MKERNNSYKGGSKNSWSKTQLANFVKVYNRRHRKISYFVNAMVISLSSFISSICERKDMPIANDSQFIYTGVADSVDKTGVPRVATPKH